MLSLVVASGGHSSSRCTGPSLSRPLLLRSTGSRRTGSAIVAHGPSRSVACGILPDQGPNPCPLHWQADSQPLRHQGSPSLSNNNPAFQSYSQSYCKDISCLHVIHAALLLGSTPYPIYISTSFGLLMSAFVHLLCCHLLYGFLDTVDLQLKKNHLIVLKLGF